MTPSVLSFERQGSLYVPSAVPVDGRIIRTGVGLRGNGTVQTSGGPNPNLTATMDWSHGGTGTSDMAVLDDGRISLVDAGGATPATLRVMDRATQIPSAPSEWPVNMLRLETNGPNSRLVGWDSDGWEAPAEGQSIFFRLLFYSALAEGSGVAFEHGCQSNVGDIRHCWQFFSPQASYTELGFGSDGRSNYIAHVTTGRPYRLEWALSRGATTFVPTIRVYDESVSVSDPAYETDDFLEEWGSGPDSIADLTPYTTGSVSEAFRRYIFGLSGSSSGVTAAMYVGGFAVSLTDWCGQYVQGEAD